VGLAEPDHLTFHTQWIQPAITDPSVSLPLLAGIAGLGLAIAFWSGVAMFVIGGLGWICLPLLIRLWAFLDG
jgi:hypothetical protein